jgi:hypothetical protein
MDLKLPFALTTDYSGTNGGVFQTTLAGAPQLVFGFQYGRLGVGAGLGFARVGQTNVEILNPGNPGLPGGVTNSSSSSGEVLIAPTVTFDAFRTHDRKVALYLLGAPIFGLIFRSQASAASDIGFQFAVGADVALHENFLLGLEAGPIGHFYGGQNSGGGDNTITLYTAIVATFVYPR